MFVGMYAEFGVLPVIPPPARPFLDPVFQKFGADETEVSRRFLERRRIWAVTSVGDGDQSWRAGAALLASRCRRQTPVEE